ADAGVGTLATVDVFYDTLRHDIERSDFKHVTLAVRRVEDTFGRDSFEATTARAIAALQILNDFPTDEENLSALLHPHVEAESQLEKVRGAVATLIAEPGISLSRTGEGKLRFMSEAIQEVDGIRNNLHITGAALSNELSQRIRIIFSPLPNVRLSGTRKVQTGIKLVGSRGPLSVEGEREAIQTVIEFAELGAYDRRQDELLADSSHPAQRNTIFWLARKNSAIDRYLLEIKKSETIHGQYRSRAVEKEISQYLDSQLKQAATLRSELDEMLRQNLSQGSFIFRGDPTAVSTQAPEVDKAIEKQLDDVASRVFSKYPLAPVQADTGLARKFLDAKSLDRAADQFDPVKLIKKVGGALAIDTKHPALVAICDYLGEHGRKDGKSLMNDLFEPEFGWSKDTTRYLLAALFRAGKIQLRMGGDDITVVGEQALAAFQNSNSFDKVGISLRDQELSPEAKLRAVDRLLDLTGEAVDPLEDEISRAVLKHFAGYGEDFASLAVQLDSAGLSGTERAGNLLEELRQILAADASSAAPVLGAEICDLHDDILWARKLRKVFKEGLLDTVRNLRRHLSEIESLPNARAAGKLKADTADLRSELGARLDASAFYDHQAEIQSGLSKLKVAVDACCRELIEELSKLVNHGAETLQALPEWSRLNEEHRENLVRRLEALKPSDEQGLSGLRILLSQPYAISPDLEAIRQDILRLATEGDRNDDRETEDEKAEVVEETVVLPTEIGSETELESLIEAFRRLGDRLKRFKRVRLKWKTGDNDHD
ncbi:MAG TPA: hypothetical protein PLA50_00045, partial [Bacteroidia bacterium]|nr:hypothetical protein [Bacteroidia bacterium]